MEKLKKLNVPMVVFLILFSKLLIFGINSFQEALGLLVVTSLYGYGLYLENSKKKSIELRFEEEFKKIADLKTDIEYLNSQLNNVQGSVNTIKLSQGIRSTSNEQAKRFF